MDGEIAGPNSIAMEFIKTDQQRNNITKVSKLKILALENINETALSMFKNSELEIEFYKDSLSKQDLLDKIEHFNIVCIRSKTTIDSDVLKRAKNLLAIGCFCIGVNQVDLEIAAELGIPVFNSPFCNSRSVAELVMAEIIMLSRQLGDRNNEMHKSIWNKASANCYEIRGKTLGIVGYGHIGTQLSILAESFGMKVIYHDITKLMALGMATSCNSIQELVKKADFVSFHVPETKETKNMVNKELLSQFKKNSYLINASRGSVVDLTALKEALDTGHIKGAAIDVFPIEPKKSRDNAFEIDLMNCKNVILTPHIGGSTEEAQSMIGIEVATRLLDFVKRGSSLGAVNYPNVALRDPIAKNGIRILYTHRNVPGILKQINNFLGEYNVDAQICDSREEIAYLMIDIRKSDNTELSSAEMTNLLQQVSSLKESLTTRISLASTVMHSRD